MKTVWPNLLITACCLLVFSPVPVPAQRPVPDRVQPEAHAFRLEDVRLLDGPFKHAMTRDAEYLLRLNADRLLLERAHNLQGDRMDTGEHSGRKWHHALPQYEAPARPGDSAAPSDGNSAGGFYGVRVIRKE